MKRFLKAFIPLTLAVCCFAGCSDMPDEPATTAVEKHTYINEVGETVPVAENIADYPGITQPPKFIATTHEIEVVVSSYYVCGDTVVTYENVEIENVDAPPTEVFGTLDCVLTSKGKEKEMKIAYNAYDENGELLKKDGCLARTIGNLREDDEISFSFGVPLGTAKIEFFDYE